MVMPRRSKGEGSLYPDKTGGWIYQYKAADGKRKTKRFQRKSDAKAFMDSLAVASTQITDTLQQVFPRQTTQIITVGEWMDRWLEVYAKPAIKLSTYVSYEQYIRGHIKPLLGDYYLNTLRVDDLQAFFNQRSQSGNIKGKGGLSPKTLTNLRNMMHLAFTQAVQNKLMVENPIGGVRLPKAQKSEMRVLTVAEQERLTISARMAPEPAAFGVIFTLFTGIRLGELCGLRWENVDMENRCFRVCEIRNRLPNFDDSIDASTSVITRQTTKTDNSRRTVYLMDGLYQDLLKYKRLQDSIKEQYPGYNPSGYVFCQEDGQPFEPRTYQDLFKRCVRRAGIADANFHSLRHTFATRSLEQGMDVVTLARLLGHANPSITLEKYGHSMEEQKRKSVEMLEGLYSNRKPLLNQKPYRGGEMSMTMG